MDRNDRDDRRDRSNDRDSRPDQGASTSVIVRNLSYSTRPRDIKDLMSALLYCFVYTVNGIHRIEYSPVTVFIGEFGEIRDVHMPVDFHSGKPRGFAFVEFYSDVDAR